MSKQFNVGDRVLARSACMGMLSVPATVVAKDQNSYFVTYDTGMGPVGTHEVEGEMCTLPPPAPTMRELIDAQIRAGTWKE